MNTSYPPIAGQDQQTSVAPVQTFAGEAPKYTGSSVSLAAITALQACALTPTGVTPYVIGTHTKDQLVIAANAAAGAAAVVGFYREGSFNHDAITWPAAHDTFAKRLAFVNGTGIAISKTLPNPVQAG